MNTDLTTQPPVNVVPRIPAASSSNPAHSSRHLHDDDDDDDDATSIATELATDVGSVVRAPKDAFLRSITFFKDRPGLDWSVTLRDPPPTTKNKDRKLSIDTIGGCIGLSLIQPGDFVKKINGRRIGPSYNAERAMALMNERFNEDEFLSLAVGNDDGDDVLVQATVLKPRSRMTYKEMGMTVWYWGVLCIKSISKNSVFAHTVLKPTDHILSINDIDCDRVSPEGFAHIINELPLEVTIVVRRGKQRWTGRFG